jgi:hypothetical protein
MANVNVLLGITPKSNLLDVITKRKKMSEIILNTEVGIQFIAGANGFSRIANLSDEERDYFAEEFTTLSAADIIIIDTGAGMSIINSAYYQEHKRDLIRLSDIEMQLVGINGATPFQTAASVGITTSIGYCRFYESDLSAVVSKMNDRGYNVIGVIGSDFWKQGYVINYQTKQVTKCN